MVCFVTDGAVVAGAFVARAVEVADITVGAVVVGFVEVQAVAAGSADTFQGAQIEGVMAVTAQYSRKSVTIWPESCFVRF